MTFQLCEELFDWIEIRAVGRQEHQMGAGVADSASRGVAFMAAEIVEDYDIALGKCRDQYLLQVKGEELTIDGSIDDPGCIKAIDA
jgi:hypothetical protein